MGQYTSYWLYQKYEKRGSQEAIPVYPNVYSVDGDGTMSKVIKIENDAACGYVPTGTTQYRWVNLDPSVDYYCDECPAVEPIYRWIKSDDTICVEYVPPTPTFNGKFKTTYSDSRTYSAECDSSTILSSGDARPSGYTASAMTSAEIGNCITSIGNNVFSGCTSLTSVTIPNTVTIISMSAFDKCTSLTNIDIPSSVTIIGDYAFASCSSLTAITIPSGVTYISMSAFAGCTSLTNIDIPSSVTTIGQYAFANCSGLTSVNIPNSVTTIERQAFEGCTSLTNIDIPSGVTYIGNSAFAGCRSLTSVTVNATTPPELGNTYVFDRGSNCPIYVPAASVDTYKTTRGWIAYADRIQAIP